MVDLPLKVAPAHHICTARAGAPPARFGWGAHLRLLARLGPRLSVRVDLVLLLFVRLAHIVEERLFESDGARQSAWFACVRVLPVACLNLMNSSFSSRIVSLIPGSTFQPTQPT